MTTRLVRIYAALAALALGGYFLIPADTWAQTLTAVGIGYLGVAGVIVGVLRRRPAGAGAWWWFAAGVFCNSTGQLVEAVIIRLFHDDSWPNASVYVYHGLYPCLI